MFFINSTLEKKGYNIHYDLSRYVWKGVIYFILFVFGFFVSFPFLWMVTSSLKTLEEATTPSLWLFPKQWQWENWIYIFKFAPFGKYFFNSFFVAGTVTFFVCINSLLAGYAFARLRFFGKNVIFALVMATMMVPFEAVLIPNFILISRLGWYNTYFALIFPWCANAFSILMLRQAFMTIPNDYYESAQIDGCSHISFLIHLAIPFVKPALITVALFSFLNSYNSLLWPLIVTADETKRVVQVGLTVFSGDAGVRVNLLMTASTLVALPTIIIYLIAQRYFFQESIRVGLKG
ncbi:MAG TPA: carbohydrate ABC transporter permease [Candidatus Hydrogenedens sp.]|nr:carbohydrate ABC transporter permease [Candidatus Hydrogenedens sp.]HOK08399.1 carbohydrate ABC transporter permease [Candidatus Hydrogenedens sp.]HOL20699.1 carbohydrate ABC transporter permease [Candidatus Hydrogenedens sp.]HPP58188.1 carbohydrate ABC transporter permease [Candidatus Hydrogenedens sp.]